MKPVASILFCVSIIVSHAQTTSIPSGLEALKQNRFNKAISIFKSLSKSPQDSYARYMLATSYQLKGVNRRYFRRPLVRKAEGIFDGLLEQEKLVVPCLYRKGLCRISEFDFQNARSCFDSLISRDPFIAKAYYYKAWCLRRSDEDSARSNAIQELNQIMLVCDDTLDFQLLAEAGFSYTKSFNWILSGALLSKIHPLKMNPIYPYPLSIYYGLSKIDTSYITPKHHSIADKFLAIRFFTYNLMDSTERVVKVNFEAMNGGINLDTLLQLPDTISISSFSLVFFPPFEISKDLNGELMREYSIREILISSNILDLQHIQNLKRLFPGDKVFFEAIKTNDSETPFWANVIGYVEFIDSAED